MHGRQPLSDQPCSHDLVTWSVDEIFRSGHHLCSIRTRLNLPSLILIVSHVHERIESYCPGAIGIGLFGHCAVQNTAQDAHGMLPDTFPPSVRKEANIDSVHAPRSFTRTSKSVVSETSTCAKSSSLRIRLTKSSAQSCLNSLCSM